MEHFAMLQLFLNQTSFGDMNLPLFVCKQSKTKFFFPVTWVKPGSLPSGMGAACFKGFQACLFLRA